MRWSRKTFPLTRNVCLPTVFRQHNLRYTNSPNRGMRSRSLHHIADILPPHTQRTTLHNLPRTQPLIRRCNKPGSLLTFKTRLYVIVLSSLDPHVAECAPSTCSDSTYTIIGFPKILKTYDSIMQKCRTLQHTIPLHTTKLHKCIQLLLCS